MNFLTPSQTKLIEEMKKYASLETKGLLSIIDKQQCVIDFVRQQRGICDQAHLGQGPCRYQIYDQELQKIMEGEG